MATQRKAPAPTDLPDPGPKGYGRLVAVFRIRNTHELWFQNEDQEVRAVAIGASGQPRLLRTINTKRRREEGELPVS